MKITPIYQSESSECGLACLAMVCDAYDLEIGLSELRRRFPVSLKGATLASLIRYAADLHLMSRPLRLELSELSRLRTPCILHWEFNHFVVLEKATANKVTILDPALGRRVLSLDEVSDAFTGVALELEPSPQFEPQKSTTSISLRQLTGQTRGLTRALVQVFLLALALEIFALIAPQFSQFILDEVVVSKDKELLWTLLIGFVLLLLTQTFISMLRSWVILRLGQQVRFDWSGRLFRHMLRLPGAFFEKRHQGDIVSRFDSLHSIQNALTTALVASILDGIMAVFVLAFLFWYSVPLTFVVLVIVLLYAVLRFAFYRPLRTLNQKRIVQGAKEQSYFLETLRAITPLKLANKEEERRVQWQTLFSRTLATDTQSQGLLIWMQSLDTSLKGLGHLLMLGLGAKAVMDGNLTVGMLMAFASYADTFIQRVNSLVGYAVDLRLLRLHTERISDIALEPVEPMQEAERDISRLSADIELSNVSFRYVEGEPWVLSNINLTIHAGQNIAITGVSGGGKTTLLKIILGILQPTEGEVRFGGIPVSHIGLSAYRRQIAAVLQEDSLLAGSVGDNIAFFDAQYSQERVEQSAQLAAIHDEIMAMPMGYHTLVGDMGSSLSGGQKQRVLLARAFYLNPRVLVLDEASSHLDAENELRVNQAINAQSLTRIVVAHRKETIALADRVVVLNAGHIDSAPAVSV